ncbi:MAG TPA: hypothetical protein VJ869_04660 [Sphaerochaeta sp.]|nr:hypothetical protein [Sphaerochaeta sp.]
MSNITIFKETALSDAGATTDILIVLDKEEVVGVVTVIRLLYSSMDKQRIC